MPAIQLEKLREQCSQLKKHFENPEALIQSIVALLDAYAERTHRAGLSGEPPPLLYTYNVPKPVLRQILLEITPLATTHTDLTLELCDRLWQNPVFELRWIAASLIGYVAPTPPEPIFNRIQNWGLQTRENQMIDILFDQGLLRLRSEAPEQLIQYIRKWLDDSDQKIQLFGIKALIPLISKTEYENIPAFFKLITPYLRHPPPHLRNDLRDLIQELAIRSPVETASHLRQFLEITYHPDLAWLARQCLPFFPQGNQASLRKLLRGASISDDSQD